ncbi:MAG: Gfo/Idh/MocA family oxidoreductase [Pirellulaceae bacterium]|nr:Gfo/Idh/MocA family oxidoreductase [Pirellulaceae bacterium]
MNRVRWGVLSSAKIGTEKVIPAMQAGEHAEITAIASRNQERAQAVADQLAIPKSYGSYEALLTDPDIDAIYNPLPNHLHVEWSIKAIEAGKHVLCEKPIGLTADEGQKLVEVAERNPTVKVMEAFMYRHHPQWQRAYDLITAGEIGVLKTIQSFFSYFNDDPQNIRNQGDIGGGGLMDIGCYNISLSRFLFQSEPNRVYGVIDYDPQFETDRLASGILEFEQGTSTFTCSTQLSPYQRVNCYGSDGRVEIEIPFNAPADRPCRMWLQQGGQVAEISLETTDQYTVQGDLMSLAILNDQPVPTPIADAVANMRIIEAIKASGQSKTSVAM